MCWNDKGQLLPRSRTKYKPLFIHARCWCAFVARKVLANSFGSSETQRRNFDVSRGPSRANPAEFVHKMTISAITLVILGKGSEAFLSRGGRKAKEDSCFSIHAGPLVLSLEADTKESRNHWSCDFAKCDQTAQVARFSVASCQRWSFFCLLDR